MKTLAAFLTATAFFISLSSATAQTPTTATAEQPGVAAIDMSAWTEPYPLFTGTELEGWKFMHGPVKEGEPDPDSVWKYEDGVLTCTGAILGYIRTQRTFTNYQFSFEWRWTGEPGNNGVLLHVQGQDKIWPLSVEGQLKSGSAGDVVLMGGATSMDMNRPMPGKKAKQHLPAYSGSNEKPAGEWNEFKANVVGDRILILINGMLKNVVTGCSLTSGHIALQSEGAPIEFRNIKLERTALTAM
jgi:hypothetical protein